MPESFILIFSCNDKAGIQSKVSTFLFERSAFLTDVKSFSDSETHSIFLRALIKLSQNEYSLTQINEDLNYFAEEFDMESVRVAVDRTIQTIIALVK